MITNPPDRPIWRMVRSMLFRLDPELAHESALRLAHLPGAALVARLMGCRPVNDPVTLFGVPFANRIGLAAGLDKNGRHIDALAALGFGFLEVGTVTPRAQPGNARPRLFRIASHEALINRFGFNNEGLDAFVANVQRSRFRGTLGLNIGKNADTPNERAIDDYVAGLRRCHPHAAYITVNISSPNTRNLRDLQHAQALSAMLAALTRENHSLGEASGRRVALLLKIAPDLDEAAIDDIAQQLVDHHLDGVIATNTTLARDGIAGADHAHEAGGLSGAPLGDRATGVIARLRRVLPSGFPIIGVGGIVRPSDALARLDSGADLVQLYSGLIYRGPGLIAQCALAASSRRAQLSPD